MSKLTNVIKSLPKFIVAIILLQTLWFKFGIGGEVALNQSKELFASLTQSLFGSAALEPAFRIGVGILELIASVLVLMPKTSLWGALLASGLMLGALVAHVFFIGISFQGDGGQLMILAVIVLVCSVKIIWDEQETFSKILP